MLRRALFLLMLVAAPALGQDAPAPALRSDVEFARRAGADVVALTDSPEAPIAPSAQQVLIAQSDMASYVDSLVAPLSLLNAIIVAVSRTNEEAVRERLQKLEHIWDEYDVYDKNQG